MHVTVGRACSRQSARLPKMGCVEMSVYGTIYRNLLFPLYESRLRGRKTLKYLKELERTQWLPMEEVKRRQWERLCKMLHHAYEEAPFYRRSFDQAGLKPGDIQRPEDFAQVPFLEKRHLQDDQDDLLARSYRDRPLISSHSGGSTGEPVEFKYDRDHYDRRVAAWARADRWAGWDLGERLIILWLGVGSGVGDRRRPEVWKEHLHWMFMRWKVITCTKLSHERAREYHKIMCRFRPRSMYALAQSAYAFALLLENLGLQPPAMRGIILGAEKIFPRQRKKIEEVFGTPTFERYGSQEFCNIGEECEYHDGMHINADGVYVEVVGTDGRPVPPGEVGEVVVTSLDNLAMPFVRYRLGDMAIMAEGPCPCGRGLPRIKEILGRTCDMVVTPEGTICSGVMMPHFMKEFSCVKQFQFVQDEVDHLTLRMVPGEGWNPEARRYMEQELRRYVGPTMRIDFEEAEELERHGTGKYRMVVSKIDLSDVVREGQKDAG